MGKQSQITGMLLSNYILSINLMKSIAHKFTQPDEFEAQLEGQLQCLERVETSLNTINQQSARGEEQPANVAISYLVT
jgi:hypothetical protein